MSIDDNYKNLGSNPNHILLYITTGFKFKFLWVSLV